MTNRFQKKASALVTTLFVLVVLSTIVVAFLTSMNLERKISKSLKTKYQAELAAEAGVEDALLKIINGATNGVSFTSWAYFGTTNSWDYKIAITSGIPTLLGDTNYLSTNNTIWLFSDYISRDSSGSVTQKIPADPNTINSLSESQKTNLNRAQRIMAGTNEFLAPWNEFIRRTNGSLIEVYRFAYLVDDESSRVDIRISGNTNGTGGNHLKDLGESVSEIPLLNVTNSSGMDTLHSNRSKIISQKSIFQLFPDFSSNSWLLTKFNAGYELIQYGAQTGSLARTASPKFNLNWSGLTNTNALAQIRVNYIADFMDAGATNFLANLKYGNNKGNVPNSIKGRIKETIAASIIDYRDSDHIPIQPSNLMNPMDTNSPAPPVRLMNTAETPEPRFFGIDTTPRINEVMTVWNANTSNSSANSIVDRTSIGGLNTYSIPIAWRFELWNMHDSPIPARNYKIRATYLQQIRASAFGFGGSAIPPDTEKIFDLGSLSFEAGEIKVVTIKETFTSAGPNDRGTTWSQFRNGPNPNTDDDEPDGHVRTAYILFDADTNQWLHATTYHDGTEAPADGVNTVGIGGKGDLKGNRINDPRMETLRSFSSDPALSGDISLLTQDDDRDASSAKPGSIGTINNNIGSSASTKFNYQHLDFWFDRPYISNGNATASKVALARISNTNFVSIGELGNIWDPSWIHPRAQGTDNETDNQVAYKSTLIPLFKGGASLRIGQPDSNTNYLANSWSLLDLFAVGTNTSNQSAPVEWTGKININVPKAAHGLTNLDLVLRVPFLEIKNPALGTSTNINTSIFYEEMRTRLGVPNIASWSNALPMYTLGEISQLNSWTNTNLYQPAATLLVQPTTGTGETLKRLNLADSAREEVFRRSAQLFTTKGHAFRIYSIGQYLTAPANAPEKMKVISSSFTEQSAFLPMTPNSSGIYMIQKPIVTKIQTE